MHVLKWHNDEIACRKWHKNYLAKETYFKYFSIENLTAESNGKSQEIAKFQDELKTLTGELELKTHRLLELEPLAQKYGVNTEAEVEDYIKIRQKIDQVTVHNADLTRENESLKTLGEENSRKILELMEITDKMSEENKVANQK